MYPVTDEDRADLARRFMHHPPKGNQEPRYEENRLGTAGLSTLFLRNCPPSAERDKAVEHLETALFYANAAIARNEVHLSMTDFLLSAYAEFHRRQFEVSENEETDE